MLGSFRGILNTWPARLFFLLLAGAFALWGISGRNPFGIGASPTAVATVAGQTIDLAQAETEFRRNLQRAQQALSLKGEIPDELRRKVAIQSVESLVTQAAMQARVQQLRLVVTDQALRDAAFAMPAFQGRDGHFDHAHMLAVLQSNGYSEAGFLDLLRRDLVQRQLLGAVTAGVATPKLLGDRLFAYFHETRTADAVTFPFAAAPEPSPPSQSALQHWYDNHPRAYSTPEYRRIKAIILSPETVSKDIAVSDEEIAAAYAQHKAEYVAPARRSVQVLTVPDQAAATRLAAQWSVGADWATMQKAAQDAGATAVELDDASSGMFPAPELAQAAFSTSPDTVAPPIHGALGWYVVKVVKATPGGTQTLAEATPALRARIVAEKAVDLIDDRSGKIDDMLQGGTGLDQLPGDMGLGAVTGTLDARGNTPSGTAAPIPGSPELRAAVVAAAFQAHKGDPLKLQSGPPGPGGVPTGYFALSLEDVLPPSPRPFAAVADAVRTDWLADARRREQDRAATTLLLAVQHGTPIAQAAQAQGIALQHLPPVSRITPADGVPQALAGPLFALQRGEATMVDVPGGYMVASLVATDDPTPASDPIGHARLVEQLDGQIAQDLDASFAVAVRDAAHPHVNQTLVDQLAQPGG